MENYLTVMGVSTGEYEEKRSKFICEVRHAESADEAEKIIEKVRSENPGARHVVSAYRLTGGYEHFSDDGEPSGTGGKPLLEMLCHKDLTDTVITVTRYFGGVLLGVGGLKRAYTAAAKEALEKASVLTKSKAVMFSVSTEYSHFEKIATVVSSLGGVVSDKRFSDGVEFTAVLPHENADGFAEFLTEYTAGRGKIIEKKETLYNFTDKKSVF